MLAALGITQILGWGTAYFLPGVLGAAIEADLGLPAGTAFAGIAILLGLAGALAPRVGRAIDRHGARPAMATGSCAFAAGLVLLAFAQGPAQAVAASLVMGVAGALALTEAANAALAALGAEGARRRLGFLALASGLSSAVTWPGLAALEALWGWRGAVLAAAAIHLAVALPLHLLCIPAAPRGARPARAPATGPLPVRLRWLSAALTLQVLVGSAVLANMVALVQALGLERGSAIWWAALIGPAQVAARLLDVLGGGRFRAVTTASAALLLMPAALLLPLVVAGSAPAFVLAYGLASGVMSVMRPACLIELHGTEGYATVAGRVMAPVTTAMALAPAAFAPLLAALGAEVALAVAGLGSVGAFLLLRMAARST
ncbi:MFS transporter [Falsiroseomonas selenitidurans]|uniref:MFS transporter n=1 Tax=Falsiroseomonas selenitidurans TaxID=2716335 RepID=A0ABX1E5D2_9PROT|nr:MFS transporter [Falsiroseomonas selenitidurans]NKC31935.1 MFS transporter [Falsiroseomonas selenitidurans]